MPVIDSVSLAENPPLNGWRHTGAFTGEISAERMEENLRERYDINDVGDRYFATLGTKVIAGRDFSSHDGDANTCILNRSAAASLFPAQRAIGQPVRQLMRSMDSGAVTMRDCRVIGIVEDAKYSSLRDPAPPTVYLPLG